MLNFNLRGIPPEVMLLLKKEAKRIDTSVNSLILTIIKRELGFTHERVAYHDLDHLAGTWNASEAEMFTKNTRYFEQIDKELWE